ncbi:MAG TPA: UDP-N-acetylglucosamine--N-acetylmuramyl-(pentapeptide) pyrophosphoryl-undecaprenol N-acetylglucosamine transferase [Chlamydiales bacterium]|nr:UDP-N-acetylglucosamine--N-acetylmuramyl-(pentapeptide) pyrophosphoryl-undecaprenol N-acetylglucosamine transferase [Chlamydiales bacterium]
MKKILIAVGGTGGHLFPAQQLAAQLQNDFQILFAGYQLQKNMFFAQETNAFMEIAAHPLKKGFFKASRLGMRQALAMLKHFEPDVVVGFGSYHTFPILLAAAMRRKKLVLFEANCMLGKVNRVFRFFANYVACQFPLTLKNAVLVEWLPWKKPEPIDPKAARIRLGLDPGKKTLLIFGGSQGASFFNEIIPKVVWEFKKTVQVIHLTGVGQTEAVRSMYEKFEIQACVKPFESEMAVAYSAADIAICRSGAGTIAELIRFAVPALLIPYPFAADEHQRKNGEMLAHVWKGARQVLQNQADVSMLCRELEELEKEAEECKSRLRLKQMDRERTSLAEVIRKMR